MKLPKNFSLQLDQKIQDLDLQLKLLYFKCQDYEIPIINLYTKNDDDNLFSITLNTHVCSSKGLAHILEHTVLCGSKKYQVRDPFFAMIRRSLNSFMNAFTATTWTSYPAASRVKKDYYNLLDLYVDAVFYPQLTDESIFQEGYRLELENKDPLKIKECGVVYNEMRGSFDNPYRQLMREYAAVFFQDHCSSYVSGGYPEKIREITPDAIRNFHAQYYDPRNSLFYFYGNYNIEEILHHLNRSFFSHLDTNKKFEAIPPLGEVTRFKKPKYMEASYPNQTIDRASMVLISYLTKAIESPADLLDLLALRVLDAILTGHDGAKFKQEMLKEKNEDGTPLFIEINSYLDDTSTELAFTLLFKGCNKGCAKKIKKVIDKKLIELSEKPFTKEEIDSAIHQEKFVDLEIEGSGEKYALELFFRSSIFLHTPKENAESVLVGALNPEKTYQLLEEKCSKDPLFLNKFITKYLLNNNHTLTLEFNPDKSLAKKEEKEIQNYLTGIEERLSNEEITAIEKKSQRLKEYQEEDESAAIDKLPILEKKDLPKEITMYDISTYKDSLTIYHHECFTNSIVYAEVVFNIGAMDQEDLGYLRLFSMFCTEVGTLNVPYTEHLKEVEQFLGSLNASLHLDKNLENPKSAQFLFILQAKCFSKNSNKMFDILQKVISGVDFSDEERLLELISQSAKNMEISLKSKAHAYAIYQSAATLSPVALLHEKMYGYSFYQFVQHLSENIKTKLPELQEKFKAFADTILNYRPEVILNCEKQEAQEIIKNKLYNLNLLKFQDVSSLEPFIFSQDLSFNSPPHQSLELQMANNASAIKTIDITNSDAAYLLLASYILRNNLHTAIREKGGAYGAYCSFKPLGGVFFFSSYRDPHTQRTFEAFEESLQVIVNNEFDEKNLFEAKLQAMQKEEKRLPIHMRAFKTFINKKTGLSPKIQKQYRERILNASSEDVIRAIKQYLLPQIPKMTKISYK